MSTAIDLAPSSVQPLSWERIRELHPNEWVCLLDVENTPEGAIRSAHVVAHDPSMRNLLELTSLHRDAVVTHTSNRPWWTPRIELTDEIRDIVRPRR
jgi:hypothetical protein